MEVGHSPLCAPKFENNKGLKMGYTDITKKIITKERNYSLVGNEDTAGRRADG